MTFGACSLQTPYLPKSSISDLEGYIAKVGELDRYVIITGLLSDGLPSDLDDFDKKDFTGFPSDKTLNVSGETAELYWLESVKVGDETQYRAIYQIGNTYAAFILKDVHDYVDKEAKGLTLVQHTSFGYGFDETEWNNGFWSKDYLLPYAWDKSYNGALYPVKYEFTPEVPLAGGTSDNE